jgi:hypothetical protein
VISLRSHTESDDPPDHRPAGEEVHSENRTLVCFASTDSDRVRNQVSECDRCKNPRSNYRASTYRLLVGENASDYGIALHFLGPACPINRPRAAEWWTSRWILGVTRRC